MCFRQGHIKRFWVVLLLTASLTCCRQAYDPPAVKAANRYLVVDGFINTGANTVTSFRINWTRNLGDTVTEGDPELNATVSVTGDHGASFILSDPKGTGTYSSPPQTIDITQQYRIVIITSHGGKYSSDAVPCKQTPPIDSLFWRQPGDFTVYVATHDPANATRYYRYDYFETWEHDANIVSPWGVVNGNLVATDSTNQKWQCWSTDTSTNVLIASSAALVQDVITAFPVATVPQGDTKINIGYSILVRQYALTAEAYNYWLQIQKTSQDLGTLFDVQPTQLVGNIHCLTNPSEPVIGFLSASSVQQRRLFVYQTYLSNWIHNAAGFGCDTIQISYNPNNFPAYNPVDTSYGPYYFDGPTTLVLAPWFCLDCTRFGGTTVKPPFWP
jgi:hypothetical protein